MLATTLAATGPHGAVPLANEWRGIEQVDGAYGPRRMVLITEATAPGAGWP